MDLLPVVEEALDTIDDQAGLVTMENIVIDLEHLFDEMQKEKGVNKTMAIALEAINPELLPERYPSISFTVETSQTNYRVALEAVTAGMVAGIAALVAGIAIVLLKIIRWIRGTVIGSLKRTKHNEAMVKNSTILVKEIIDIERRSAPEDLAGYDAAMETIAEDFNHEFLSMHSDLLKELTAGNKVRTALVAVGGNIDKYIEQINNKLVIYEQAIRLAKDDSQEQAVISKLSEQQKAISLMNATNYVDNVIGSTTPGVISESLPAFKDTIWQLADEKSTNPFTYKYLFEALRSGKIVVDDSYIKDVERTDKNLGAIEKRLESLEGKNDKIQASRLIIEELRGAGDVIKQEIFGLQAYIAVVNKVLTINGQFATTLNIAVNRHYKQVLSVAGKSQSQHTRDMGRRSRQDIPDKLDK